VQNNNEQNAPSPSGADLKVKPMLGGRASRANNIYAVCFLKANKILFSIGDNYGE